VNARGVGRVGALVAAIALTGAAVAACSGDSSGISADGTTTSAPPPTTGTPTTTTTPVRLPTLGVGLQSQTFVDTSRPTPAANGKPELPSRTLPTAIFYPSLVSGTGAFGFDFVANAPPAKAFGPWPLVIWAHGVTGEGQGDLDEFEPWVQAGYVVAAPTFPLSSGPNGIAGALVDTVNQPADMSFVLTEVLKLADDSSNPLHGLLEHDHVAAAGHSLGAITVLGFYSNQYADPRFKAIVDESGAGAGFLLKDNVFDGIKAPLLAAHGLIDDTVPAQADYATWLAAPPPKFFLALPNEGHNPPFFPPVGDPPTPLNLLVDGVVVAFLDAYLKGEKDAVARMEKIGNVPNVATLIAVPT
jgi:dienelactone hydrolase